MQMITGDTVFVHEVEKRNKQGGLDDAREITASWNYFRDSKVEQFFKFFLKEFEKGNNLFIVKILFSLILHIYFNKMGKTQQNKSLYFINIQICQFLHLIVTYGQSFTMKCINLLQ